MPPKVAHHHGLLVVDKPGPALPPSPIESSPLTGETNAERLYTSHDIVQIVRRCSHQRRVGHTGTLDPMASGVLVLCLGTATRLVEYYQGHDKQYLAEVVLGRTTDTYDAMGRVTASAPVPPLTVDQLETVLSHFRGDILQRPPIYSALKQGGESLHRKARRGESVSIVARPITVHSLHLVDWIEPNRIQLRIRCSAGTYVRSLAHDIGQILGTGAFLGYLRREEAGAFGLNQAHSLVEIEQMATSGRFADLLLPSGTGLGLPRITLTTEQATRFGYGQTVILAGSDVQDAEAQTEEISGDSTAWNTALIAQGFDMQGIFLGIIRCLGSADPPSAGWRWKAEKWLASPATT